MMEVQNKVSGNLSKFKVNYAGELLGNIVWLVFIKYPEFILS